MKKWYIALLLIAVLFFSWRYYQYRQALAALPDRQVLIEASLDQKLNDYAQRILDKCRSSALEDAKEIADSIAFAKADALMLFDTLSRPVKPTKPIAPDRLTLKDSTEVRPLIDSLY